MWNATCNHHSYSRRRFRVYASKTTGDIQIYNQTLYTLQMRSDRAFLCKLRSVIRFFKFTIFTSHQGHNAFQHKCIPNVGCLLSMLTHQPSSNNIKFVVIHDGGGTCSISDHNEHLLAISDNNISEIHSN